jgi:hypothetical protein
LPQIHLNRRKFLIFLAPTNAMFIILYFFQVAAIFLFNLLTGVGILALPAAVAKAGLVSGVLVLAVVAFMAFVSLTFVVEVLSTANAWTKLHPTSNIKGSSQNYPCKNVGEKLVVKSKLTNTGYNPFEIKEKVEMGRMAELFLGSAGSTFFYAVLCLYLYGVSTHVKYKMHSKPSMGGFTCDVLAVKICEMF